MARYDEDLHENPFFNTLVTKYNIMFSEAAEKKLMIFVPRADTVPRLKLNKTDFENHIFRQSGGDSSTTLVSCNGKVCVIAGDVMTTEQGYKEQRSVRILFEECFYNSRDESYQVFCLEQPLEGTMTEDAGAVVRLETLEDCNNYLWRDPVSDKVKKSVDNLLEFFQMEHGGSLRTSMDAASAVYTRAVQEVWKIRRHQSASQRNFCKLAVETYVMAGLHKKTFKEICFLVAHRDSSLNRITRNLTDIPPEYLGIKAQFRLSIPQAKKVLGQLNQLTSPLDKMNCLKLCVSVFTQMPLEGHFDALTADELLPILVYLVIISDIPNWHGNIAYINNFHFSRIGVEEFAYNVTSFEAAMEYVSAESSQLASMDRTMKVPTVRRPYHTSNIGDDENLPISQFFKAVSEGNVEKVSYLLREAEEEARAAKDQLCHPLCYCEQCTALEDRQMDNSHRVTVFSRDVDGRTALHIAARIGSTELVSVLLDNGAIVTATDHHGSTPLHLACQKGHQRTVLLLLGEESLINAADIHGNTCLHLACSNGHKECVKALIFHKDQCDINAANAQGDTPLHNAARWGYANIVSLLLEHKASTTIQNSRTETPAQCAQSRKVQDLLYQARRQSDGDIHRSVSLKMKRIQPKRKADSMTDATERLLKKLFRAINDDDANFVRYLFGWSEEEGQSEQLCHPLCVCEECTRLRKTTALGSNLTVNTSDGAGVTPAHRAAQLGRRRVMELLLSHGATINCRTSDQLTPLHLACQYNHKDVVLLLLEGGAEVNPQDCQGNTPLHFASQNGHMESTTLLLIHEADVGVTNNRGDTPLHSAAKWNRPMIVHNLLLYGAQYTALNHSHQTPLELTNDEEVQLHIVNAASGVIDVGSYRRLPLSSSSSTGGAGTTERRVDWTGLGSGATSTELRRSHQTAAAVGGEGGHWGSISPPRRRGSSSHRAEVARQNVQLAKLLRAIESFDRSSSLRCAQTDDRSAPAVDITHSLPPDPPRVSSPTHPPPSSPPLSASPSPSPSPNLPPSPSPNLPPSPSPDLPPSPSPNLPPSPSPNLPPSPSPDLPPSPSPDLPPSPSPDLPPAPSPDLPPSPSPNLPPSQPTPAGTIDNSSGSSFEFI